MSLTAEELVNKAIDQRQRGRHQEALISALAATQAAPLSANAWWQVGLTRSLLEDRKNAIVAYRKTVELAPQFAAGHARLGQSLFDEGDMAGARTSYEAAIDLDPENTFALRGLATVYRALDPEFKAKDDKELDVLTKLYELDELTAYQLNCLGIIHYNRGHQFEAIRYWREYEAKASDSSASFNLALALASPQVGQTADAVDLWRMALKRDPGEKKSGPCIECAMTRLRDLRTRTRDCGDTILPTEQWYVNYLNPFQLLNAAEEVNDLDDLDAKTVQRLRKRLLQEIELEDGKLEWLPGVEIDRSRAIEVCESLSNDTEFSYHRHVYENPALLDFLSIGSHAHFLVDDQSSPLDTIEFIRDDQDFAAWLAERFAPQFDRVFARALEDDKKAIVECMLSGRRWVLPSAEDRCFESAKRIIDRKLELLRAAQTKAATVKPSVSELQGMLTRTGLQELLGRLPSSFRSVQDEAANILCDISIACYNKHDDSVLANQMLEIAGQVAARATASAALRVQTQRERLKDIIVKEHEHDITLTSGKDTWEITRKCVRKGSKFLDGKKIDGVRWGVMITNATFGRTYEFLMAFRDVNGASVEFSWSARGSEIEAQEAFFQKMASAALNYYAGQIASNVGAAIERRESVNIGPVILVKDGITFQTKGFIFSKDHFVPWRRVKTNVSNGDLIVWDELSPRTTISMTLRETYNAVILRFFGDTLS